MKEYKVHAPCDKGVCVEFRKLVSEDFTRLRALLSECREVLELIASFDDRGWKPLSEYDKGLSSAHAASASKARAMKEKIKKELEGK